MKTIDITLRITYDEKQWSEPDLWDWYTLLDLYNTGEVSVRKIKEIK